MSGGIESVTSSSTQHTFERTDSAYAASSSSEVNSDTHAHGKRRKLAIEPKPRLSIHSLTTRHTQHQPPDDRRRSLVVSGPPSPSFLLSSCVYVRECMCVPI